jgi:tetratricopeptide (TPR) repeat protein
VSASPDKTAEEHYYAGIDFFGEGKLPEAIAEYTRALELNPQFSDALHGLAQAYHAQQDFDRTIATARRILVLDPEDILAWTTISRAFQRKGMVPEAEEAGNKARILGWKQQLREQKANSGKP